MASLSLPSVPRTRAARRAYWQDLLSQWAQSGEAVSEFCAERALACNTFYRWRRRLVLNGDGARQPIMARPGPFQPLPLAPAGEVEVLLAQGARVRLSGVAAERIVRQRLETLAC